MIQGGARKHVLDIEDLKFKRSLVTIRNNDNSCLPRAIAVGYAHLNVKSNPTVVAYKKIYKRLRDSRNSSQASEAEKLRIAVGISSDKVGSLDDIPLYEEYLHVGICVIVNCNCGICEIENSSGYFFKVGSLDDIPLYEEYLHVGICVISLSVGNKRVYNVGRTLSLFLSNQNFWVVLQEALI